MPAGPVIARRGASAHAPENTVAALAQAWNMGCDWASVDLRLARDGVVAMHDATLERTTDGAGPVALARVAEIARLRTRSPQTGEPTAEPPPALADVLAFAADWALGLVLEIRPTWGIEAEAGDAVAAALPREIGHPLLVTSVSTAALAALRAARPDVALGLSVLHPPRDPAAVRAAHGLRAIHADAAHTDAAAIAAMRAAGLDVAVGPVDDAAAIRRFLEMGAGGVLTNDPDLAAP